MAELGVTQEEVDNFCDLYDKAGVKLLPSAIDFFIQYGGAYRDSYIMLTDPAYNKEISLGCFSLVRKYYSYMFDPVSMEKDMLIRLDEAMEEYDNVKQIAKQEICPVAEIGYYYPALVYIGEDGRLYCVYDWTEEIEVFDDPAQILAEYLKNNIPIGVDKMPVKTEYVQTT